MDLRTKLIALLSFVLLLVIIAMYFLEVEIFATWFVMGLIVFFVFVFGLRIAQKQGRI